MCSTGCAPTLQIVGLYGGGGGRWDGEVICDHVELVAWNILCWWTLLFHHHKFDVICFLGSQLMCPISFSVTSCSFALWTALWSLRWYMMESLFYHQQNTFLRRRRRPPLRLVSVTATSTFENYNSLTRDSARKLNLAEQHLVVAKQFIHHQDGIQVKVALPNCQAKFGLAVCHFQHLKPVSKWTYIDSS